jgi:hypothetical protein
MKVLKFNFHLLLFICWSNEEEKFAKCPFSYIHIHIYVSVGVYTHAYKQMCTQVYLCNYEYKHAHTHYTLAWTSIHTRKTFVTSNFTANVALSYSWKTKEEKILKLIKQWYVEPLMLWNGTFTVLRKSMSWLPTSSVSRNITIPQLTPFPDTHTKHSPTLKHQPVWQVQCC